MKCAVLGSGFPENTSKETFRFLVLSAILLYKDGQRIKANNPLSSTIGQKRNAAWIHLIGTDKSKIPSDWAVHGSRIIRNLQACAK